MVQPLWRTVWQFLKKLRIESPHVPAIPLLGIYQKKLKNICKDTCTFIIEASFAVAKTWKQPKCPSAGDWIKRMYIYAMEYHSDTRKGKILPFATTWMALENIMLSERSKKKLRTI